MFGFEDYFVNGMIHWIAAGMEPPGVSAREAIRLRRLGTPEEAAKAACHGVARKSERRQVYNLYTDQSSYVTRITEGCVQCTNRG